MEVQYGNVPMCYAFFMTLRPLFGQPEQSVLGMSEDGLADHIARRFWEAATGGMEIPKQLDDVRTLARQQLLDIAWDLDVRLDEVVPLPRDERLAEEYADEVQRRGVIINTSSAGQEASLLDHVRLMLAFDALEAITQPVQPLSPEQQELLLKRRRRYKEMLEEFRGEP